ncbi:MAG: hypothetical protein IPP58_14260 [Holophagaceae bacterium]|uniref:Uncharacterized protein n=1 Tax=Candidatus Geothrix skivensis TaxID=2954439 RepID=A0A9D7SJ38_9BACT|nr:hypothetical protein [Candidatus Geothrix skivensis]
MLFNLVLIGSILTGCKSPICRVGGNSGTPEMKKWLNIENEKTGWLKSWQRREDYRRKKIFISEPDLSLLCEPGCIEIKKEMQHTLETYLFQPLRADTHFETVSDKSEADFEINIKIARVKEHHYIEYVSYFPPTNFYIYWFKISNIKTSKTAFWSYGMDFFSEESHRRTYPRLISQVNNFDGSHG